MWANYLLESLEDMFKQKVGNRVEILNKTEVEKMAMNIELFVSSCYLCNTTEKMIMGVMGPKCTLRMYNLAKGEGKREAEKYKVRTIPTIIGNGQKMFEGVPGYDELVKCSLEHGCKGRLLK